MLEHYVPAESAAAVARLEAAGAIVIGKTNLPEFAGDWQAASAVAGTSNNPWDTSRTTGGLRCCRQAGAGGKVLSFLTPLSRHLIIKREHNRILI